MSKSHQMVEYFTENPDAKVGDVAKEYGVHYVTAHVARKKARGGASAATGGKRTGGKRKRGSRRTRTAASTNGSSTKAPTARRGRDSDLLSRLRKEHAALGQMIELLENPSTKMVLSRMIKSQYAEASE